MKDPITTADLRRLAEVDADPAITIEMPTYQAGKEVRQNAVRFGNLLERAEEECRRRGMSAAEIKARFAELRRWEGDDNWWQHQGPGLTVLVSEDVTERYRLPVEVPEIVTAGPHFYLRSLVEAVQGNMWFYLLAVSQNQVRLFEGTERSMRRLEPDELPSDLRSALNIDEWVESLQWHTSQPVGVAGDAVYHGQGGSGAENKKRDELKLYFQKIDDALQQYFHNERVPLVFAGVDYLFPIFREACHYNGLLDQPITGSPDDATAEQLLERAKPIIAGEQQRSHQQIIERYHNAVSEDKASTDVRAIIQAAQSGLVDQLLLAREASQWGVPSEGNELFTPAEPSTENAREWINEAVVETVRTGGEVRSIPVELIPGEAAVAAVLRAPAASQKS